MRKLNRFDNVNSVSRIYLNDIIKKGDVCIDATMGKGYDTIYLSEAVGEEGFVYAFDVQKEAIVKTSEKLEEAMFPQNTKLILDGHENIDKYVKENIKCAVFNLGYLPGCEHKIITKPETTIQAIEKSLDLLCEGGVVCISVYTGHEGGKEEGNAIIEYTQNLEQKKYNVIMTTFINQKNNPPHIVLIEKKK